MTDFGKHFISSEFDSRDLAGSGINMQQAFIDKLNDARERAGIPFKINSGYRTQAHNKAVGGEPNSSHCRGWAADIAYSSGSAGWIILNALQKAGFNRIGIYKTWIHADCDPTLSQNVIWSK